MTATREARNAKVEEAAKLQEAEVRGAVEVLSIGGVAQSISALSWREREGAIKERENVVRQALA